ncbi:MAG: hypothetical protein U0930_10950 [Pirellulales bacterium]
MVEQVFCVVGGIAVFLAGIALSRMRSPDWKSDQMTDHEQRHANKLGQVQRVFRWINNKLICIIGGMIVTTAAIPHGRYWMIAWSAIFFLLLICILLAMLDALSSLFAYRHTLPSTLRGTIGEDANQS